MQGLHPGRPQIPLIVEPTGRPFRIRSHGARHYHYLSARTAAFAIHENVDPENRFPSRLATLQTAMKPATGDSDHALRSVAD